MARLPKINKKLFFISVILFLFFSVWMFPYHHLKGYIFGKIYSMTKILILAEEIEPVFLGWPGIRVHHVEVALPLGNGELDLASEKVTVRAGVSGLFPPTPAFSLYMKGLKKGGDLYLKFSESKENLTTYLDADAVELQQLNFPFLAQPLQGLLNAESDTQIHTKQLSSSSGNIDIKIEKFKIPLIQIELSDNYGFPIPSMQIGVLKSKIRIKNGVAEIKEFTFGDSKSDFSGTMTGEIKLGRDLMNSTANVILRFQFSDAIKNNAQSATMLSFFNSFKNEKGSYGIKCTKSVAEIAGCLLLPEKVE